MANCATCGRNIPGIAFGKKICSWCVRHEAAQRGEELDDARQPLMTPPWARDRAMAVGVTHTIVGINVAVFVGMVLAGISITDPSSQELIRWGANWGPLTLTGQWWRLITAVFLHIGIIHLALNMWCLWNLGELCESLYGPWTFGAVYLICGVAGYVAGVAWHPGTVSAGASGAVFGIAGALIASFYFGDFSLPRAMVRSSLRSVVMFTGYNLIFGAISGRTDNAAHLGGLAAGLVAGLLIARFAPDADSAIPRVAAVATVLLMVIGSAAWLEHGRSYLLHAERGGRLLSEGKIDEAIAELQASARERPDYVPAHMALANAYQIRSQLPQAEGELERVIELRPRNAQAYYQLGFLYLSDKRTPEAKETFAKMLAMKVNDAYGHYGLGRALAAEENHPAAIQEYQAAVRLQPEFEGAYFQIGRSETKLKKYDDAITAYLKERQIADNYETEAALADLYRIKGMQREAEEAGRKAEELKTQD